MISTNVIPNNASVDPNIKAIIFLCQASILCWSVYGQQNIQEKILNEAELNLKRFYILANPHLKNENVPVTTIDNDTPKQPSELEILTSDIKNYEPCDDTFILNAQMYMNEAKMIQAWIDMKRKDYESALIHLS